MAEPFEESCWHDFSEVSGVANLPSEAESHNCLTPRLNGPAPFGCHVLVRFWMVSMVKR